MGEGEKMREWYELGERAKERAKRVGRARESVEEEEAGQRGEERETEIG